MLGLSHLWFIQVSADGGPYGGLRMEKGKGISIEGVNEGLLDGWMDGWKNYTYDMHEGKENSDCMHERTNENEQKKRGKERLLLFNAFNAKWMKRWIHGLVYGGSRHGWRDSIHRSGFDGLGIVWLRIGEIYGNHLLYLINMSA